MMQPDAARPPTWIEVSLNGPWGRTLQPRIPIAPAEIVTRTTKRRVVRTTIGRHTPA